METLDLMTNIEGMKCFAYFDKEVMVARFHQNATDEELQRIARKIIIDSWNSRSTGGYDTFQWYTNAIYW